MKWKRGCWSDGGGGGKGEGGGGAGPGRGTGGAGGVGGLSRTRPETHSAPGLGT